MVRSTAGQSWAKRAASMRRRAISLVTALAGLGVVGPLAAAIPGSLRFESVGSAQGLSNLNVRALAQDADGYVWIGTQEGLDRFDGSTTRVFRHDPAEPQSLPSNRISALLVDTRGRLWVGTRGGGLSRYDADRESFVTYRADPDDPTSLAQGDIYALAEDAAGRLWVGTSRAGVDRLEETATGARFIHYRHADSDPASLADDRTRSLLAARDGSLWVGTMGGLDHLVDVDQRRFAHYRNEPSRAASLSDDEVWALTEDRAGNLWVGTWGGGLERLAPAARASGDFAHFRNDPRDPWSLPSDTVMLVREDAAGVLWVGTLGAGLAELSAAERAAPHPRFVNHRPDLTWAHGLTSLEVVAMLEDRDGDLWFATGAGVSRLDRSHRDIEIHRPAPNDLRVLPADTVADVVEDRHGRLWFGSRAGIHRVTPSADRFAPPTVDTFAHTDRADGPPSGEVSALLLDHRGWLWVGTLGGGLAILPANQLSAAVPRFVRRDAAADSPALASDAILSLFEDAAHTVWVGTYRGLHRAILGATPAETRFARYRHDPNEQLGADASSDPSHFDAATLSSDRVQVLAQCPDGALWVGTYNGLNRLEPATGRITRFVPSLREPGSLSYEFVRSLHCDAAGRVWAGTWGGGLDRLEPGAARFRVYGAADGLPSETLEDITPDGSGRLWLATPRGLVRFDPDRGVEDVLGEADGLLDEDVGLLRRLADGRLLVASAGGFVIVPAGWPPPRTPPPIAVLSGLRVRNQPVLPGPGSLLARAIARAPELVLGPRQDLVTFEFSALAFRRPAAVRFSYQMAGLDADWTATEARRASYSQLPPGSYRFRVRATVDGGAGRAAEGRDGRQGAAGDVPREAGIPVEVLPPWWQTWWARSGALLAVLAGALTWHRRRLSVMQRLNVALERRVAERTADLAAANQRLDEASRTDFLTGLPNRRDFLERAGHELVTFRRSGRAFAIALADIDHFKRVNDTWGHDCGDLVLREVALAVRRALREGDLVARWGGEELIFLLPDTDRDGARMVGERIRQQVAEMVVSWQEVRVPVTLTVGVAVVRPGWSFDDCVMRADAALYQGKRTGRDRVVVSDGGDVAERSSDAG